ncbi:type IV secretion system protein VirB8 [Acidiphilium acidophilum]|uniref:Type IV secretion system protein VirB8 n=1 Tax=Acidiphilium acidophilum TaxID=76588 RepID=A0AAW9DKF1_ACIAO|nr:type IV secretion system protein VirB8 [Acidiphilium acidophilum]MDX5929499.1 type IV secretion system protein VirB8 [Acidiphilium acidophilum]MEE3504482.1 type IV secretion system protein VirB8 [Acidiphilium acidophilum]
MSAATLGAAGMPPSRLPEPPLPDLKREDARTSAATPVSADRLAGYYRQVEDFQARQARGTRRWSRIAWTIAFVSLATNLALAGTIAALLPLQRLVPLYLWLRPDGTVDSTTRLSALPPTQSNAVLRAAIWQYVRDRQSYDFPDARYRYNVVSLMSAPRVLDAYQQGFLPSNPASPQNTIGRKGQISVSMISMSFVRRHVALVRYRRTVLMDEAMPVTTTWTATIAFRTVAKLPLTTRLTDPGGLIVTNYQNSEDTP